MVRSVLVVDDDAEFVALVARMFRAVGVEQILTASDAAGALAEAATHRPAGALIDIGLPDRSGADLAQEFAMLSWSPRVVLTSSDRDWVVAGDSVPVAAAVPFVPKEDLAEDTLRKLFKTQ